MRLRRHEWFAQHAGYPAIRGKMTKNSTDDKTTPKDGAVDFYRDLPEIPFFAEAVESRAHVDVPENWWVVIADVQGSTEAIQAGAYKKVNTVGVACIAAVTNVDRSIDLPFVFGGDGATLAIPGILCERVEAALRSAQRMAREHFGLSLRVGMVRVSDLVRQDYWVRVGKVRLSPHATQAAFSGQGWAEAERRVKDDMAEGVVRVREYDGPATGSYEGFECRWQTVPNFHGHKLSLLVVPTTNDPDTNLATYRQVLDQIRRIYGNVEDYHPLRAGRMRLTLNFSLLSHEWRIRSAGQGLRKRLCYFVLMLFQNLAGKILFARSMDTAAVRWSQYRNDLVDNTDFRKFDCMLRMVIDGNDEQTARLQEFLEGEYRAGRLIYGLHKSEGALITCIVRSYNGNHLHFVDGSDGGYALAARNLKERLKTVLASRD